MPIRDPSVDPRSVVELERGLEATSGVRPRSVAEARALSDEERTTVLPLARPHPVYTAALDDIAAGRVLSDARLVGWRYFVSTEGGASQAAEVYCDAANAHTFAGINEGSFVDGTLAALKTLERRDDVSGGDFEWRVLRVPALYVFAVWLRSAPGGGDLIVPLGPTHEALETERAYTAGEFVEALVEPAVEALAFEASREAE
jgi:hypothetical protein